ncbi:MAG: tryptophan 2,3-dioxygenase family protein [Rheinheimera sp.]|nr:tryptophan 2,3-dioxygenase family protein [Rheinheimera sp.]
MQKIRPLLLRRLSPTLENPDGASPESARYGNEAHDETLFIVVHQVYELWFKQILHEIKAVLQVFSADVVKDQQLTGVVHKLKRVISIQQLLNQQIGVMETMTPQDFMSFRDYLVPASGFQSIQFKMLEIGLGLKSDFRIDFDKNSFYSRLNEPDQQFLKALEHQPSLFELIEAWLERMPFWNLVILVSGRCISRPPRKC